MHRQSRIVVGVVAALAVAAAGGGGGIRARAQSGVGVPLSSNQWNTFVVDVTVRAGRVAADGRPVGVATAPMHYRWERSQSGAGWKTVMTIADRRLAIGSGDAQRAVENPFAVARIEDDENGSPLRLYRRDGGRVQGASVDRLRQWAEAGLRQLGSDAAGMSPGVAPGPDHPGAVAGRRFTSSADRRWIGAFVATPQERSARRARLQQQFVRSGQVRGLDRFTSVDGNKTLEVLADSQSAVPIEVNLLHGGTLRSHTTITYLPAADGSLVRQAVHAEQTLSAATGERAVIDTEYTGVRVERRW